MQLQTISSIECLFTFTKSLLLLILTFKTYLLFVFQIQNSTKILLLILGLFYRFTDIGGKRPLSISYKHRRFDCILEHEFIKPKCNSTSSEVCLDLAKIKLEIWPLKF